ncbi:unnamed protein product, partial [Urochloa humidicola]
NARGQENELARTRKNPQRLAATAAAATVDVHLLRRHTNMPLPLSRPPPAPPVSAAMRRASSPPTSATKRSEEKRCSEE